MNRGDVLGELRVNEAIDDEVKWMNCNGGCEMRGFL